jgi:hypothetical protein
VSGKHAARPELSNCLAYLRSGDTLAIIRLSRAMRSLEHMIELADDLHERGIDLMVLKQQIDTTTLQGRLVFHVMAALEQFTSELIVEGTVEGLAATKARGKLGGREPVLHRAPGPDSARPSQQRRADRRGDRPRDRREPTDRVPHDRQRQPVVVAPGFVQPPSFDEPGWGRLMPGVASLDRRAIGQLPCSFPSAFTWPLSRFSYFNGLGECRNV